MAHVLYDNFVLANKIEDMLLTSIDMNNYLTADNSLTEHAGMIKKVNIYDATGDVEELAMGEGNTDGIEVSFVQKNYVVEVTQGRFSFYDEQQMTDPMVVEVGLKKIAATMTNDLTEKAIGALATATITHQVSSWDFDNIVDAIALYPYESEQGLFLLINPQQKAEFRKNLGDDLKYVEAFARTGYIGSVCNVPVIVSKAVPEHMALLATKEAVTCFVKKGVEVEQERDANTRNNDVYARKVMLVALTDSTRVVKLYDSSIGFPVSPNAGLRIAFAGNNDAKLTSDRLTSYKISGTGVTGGVDDVELGTITGDYVMVKMPKACPAGTYTITQVNPALKYFYDLGDPTITKNGDIYSKTKSYTLAAADDFKFILKSGKSSAQITINGVEYNFASKFTCAE